MTPETLILLSWQKAQRQRKGAKWCKNKGIGAMRRAIGPELAVNVQPIGGDSASWRQHAEANRAAHETLRDWCAKCALCSLGRKKRAA